MFVAGLLVIPLFFADMSPDETGVPGSEGSLLFQSGFKPGYAIRTGVTRSENDKIVGSDVSVSPPNDWVEDIDNSDRLGVFTLQYQGGDTTRRKARIVPEPGNPDNHVLLMQINEPWVNPAGRDMARVQANIYDSHREAGEEGIR